MMMGVTRLTMMDSGSDGADSRCATCLDEMLGSDSGRLRGSRSNDLRMRGRKGKVNLHSLLY